MIFFLLFGAWACKKLPIYTPKPLTEKAIDPRSGYYNGDHKLLYNVYEKEDSLVVFLATGHLPSQVKIMRLGFHVWFDLNAKREKQLGVYYPQVNPETQENPEADPAASGFGQQKADKGFGLKQELVEIGFKRPNSYRAYNLNLEKPHVSAQLKREGVEMISYRLAIPKSYLLTPENTDSLISIGLISGNFAPVSNTNTQSPNMNVANPQQGMPMQGGNPGRPGMMPQQRMPVARDLTQMRGELSEAIDIWFQVDLRKSGN